ncbi:e3 ubiquitin ligase ARI4 [Fusarium mexicanum]|uniref:RBR-type E3 ubiquitin transferase n=1 Tax=Fusarium mexicanum TaxID=751941 RepID=A0A8H5IV45_9HYPO|nr:e3 ubiquitin ligase ARI4 [Fusarium mexicanum]
MSDVSDALDRVHPDFLDLLIRHELLPPEESFSEPYLARLIAVALDLAEDDEQAFLVSRIITDEELAFERLRSPEVRNTNHRIVLDRIERRIAFRDAANDPVPEQGNGEMCLVCTEDAHFRAHCGHHYCYPCYRELLRLGLSSSEGFPPRCCEPITEAGVALARAPALIHIFRQVQEEANVPIHDRLYCHANNCAAFIPPDRNGHCLLCDTHTCRGCGEQAHPGQPCREGAAEEDVWATMDANHTVNCPGCGRMIELSEACNHMTCVCGQGFCFICGEIWRTCNCPTYGGFNRMVPMRDRPGLKPEQYRRRLHPTEEAAAADEADGPARIPQLRPVQGEENRVPPIAVVGRITGGKIIMVKGIAMGKEIFTENDITTERDIIMVIDITTITETDAITMRGIKMHMNVNEIADESNDKLGGYAPGMRMDRRRDDGHAPVGALVPGMGRMHINEQPVERPPPRDERVIPRTYRPGTGPYERYYEGRLYNERDAPQMNVPRRPCNPMDVPQIDRPQMNALRRPYNPMDAPQIDRTRREEPYNAVDAEARRTNQNRLLAMNREAARLAAQDPPRQQGRNRQRHYGDHYDHPVLVDSDDDLYGDD